MRPAIDTRLPPHPGAAAAPRDGRSARIAQALKAGAADYLVKPFSPTELTARVGAALRRVARPEPFALGELAIHYEARRVTVAGRPIELTATEYELLRVLSLKAGRVVAYDALLRQVWSGRETGDVNLVRNFVKRLRAKLGDRRAEPGLDIQRARGRLPHPEPPRRLTGRPALGGAQARQRRSHWWQAAPRSPLDAPRRRGASSSPPS